MLNAFNEVLPRSEEIYLTPALERIMEERGIKTWRALAKVLGITESYLSEIRRGKKLGRRKILDFAERLGVSVAYLTGKRILIPMLSLVSAREKFALISEDAVELVDISSLAGMDKDHAKLYYALRVKDDSFLPYAKENDVLVVRRESGDMVKSGDKVVHKQDGALNCSVKFVEFSGDHVIVKPLVGGSAEVLPMADICRMDKVMYAVAFPME